MKREKGYSPEYFDTLSINSSKGFAHILMIVVLLAGLAAAIYMVQQKTNISPKAYEVVSGPITPPPGANKYSNLKAAFTPTSAAFSFAYNGASGLGSDQFMIYLSSTTDIYAGLQTGWHTENPIVVNKLNEWDKYGCGKTIYWQVAKYDGATFKGDKSSIQQATYNCTTPSPTVAPVITPIQNEKRVFMTSTRYNGNLGGLGGADAKCQARADAANVGGTWKAWLSDQNTAAGSRLTHNDGPYKLVNGITIANNWNDLTDGSIRNAINVNEFGQSVSGTPWTHTNAYSGINGTLTPCSNWTSSTDSGYPSGYTYDLLGTYNKTDSEWTAWPSGTNCSVTQTLYCFEQNTSLSPTIPVPTIPFGSDNYYLDKTPRGSVVLAVPVGSNEGFSVYASLKDQKGNVVENQEDISYKWTTESNYGFLSVTPFPACYDGIKPPCPMDHAAITTSSTSAGFGGNVWVKATRKSTGEFLAQEEFVVNLVPKNNSVTFTNVAPGKVGGEIYQAGDQIGVIWNMVGSPVYPVKYFNVYYTSYKNSGFIGTVQFPGNFIKWTIPSALIGARDVKIRIEARIEEGNGGGEGYSIWPFSVVREGTSSQPASIPGLNWIWQRLVSLLSGLRK